MVVSTVLIVILFVVIIVVILIAIVAIRNYIVYKNSPTNNTTKQKCTNNNPVVITPSTPECLRNGQHTGEYYIQSLGYLVAPFQTDPLAVCSKYCQSYSNGICTGNQNNFDNCMKLLNPSTCIGPPPLAIKETVLYYAYAPGCKLCDQCSP